VPVAHACNPSYSGDRDQEDHSLKQTRANSLQDPILKIPNTERAGGVAQGIGPVFKPSTIEKNKMKSGELKILEDIKKIHHEDLNFSYMWFSLIYYLRKFGC
jgi:hypothetical protein